MCVFIENEFLIYVSEKASTYACLRFKTTWNTSEEKEKIGAYSGCENGVIVWDARTKIVYDPRLPST